MTTTQPRTKQRSKRHHYVPQFWLREFSPDGKNIYVYDKVKKEIRKQNIKNSAVESNLNTFYPIPELAEFRTPIEAILEPKIKIAFSEIIANCRARGEELGAKEFDQFREIANLFLTEKPSDALEKVQSQLESDLSGKIEKIKSGSFEGKKAKRALLRDIFLNVLCVVYIARNKEARSCYEAQVSGYEDIATALHEFTVSMTQTLSFAEENFQFIAMPREQIASDDLLLTDNIGFSALGKGNTEWQIAPLFSPLGGSDDCRMRFLCVPLTPKLLLLGVPKGKNFSDEEIKEFLVPLISANNMFAFYSSSRYLFSKSQSCLEHLLESQAMKNAITS